MAEHELIELGEDRGPWTDRHCAYRVARHVLDEVCATVLDHVAWARSFDPNLAEHFLELHEMVSDWLNATKLSDESGNRAITSEWNRLWDDEAVLFRKLEAMLAQTSGREETPSTGPFEAEQALYSRRPGGAPKRCGGIHL